MRELTVGDQRNLAKLLKADTDLVWSDNIAPIDVNILPMQFIVSTETVDFCVEAIQAQTGFDSTFAHKLVLSVLRTAAMDIGRGNAEHGESADS